MRSSSESADESLARARRLRVLFTQFRKVRSEMPKERVTSATERRMTGRGRCLVLELLGTGPGLVGYGDSDLDGAPWSGPRCHDGVVDDLERFVEAQDAQGSFAQALRELSGGRKRSHWIWWVFPQLRGLGHSSTSWEYGIADLAEARAYLRHAVLGPRLHQGITTLLEHAREGADAVLGPDAVKVRSCLTLFEVADPDDELVTRAIEALFHGERDPLTLSMLAST